jgi:heme exporter protein A
VSPLPKTRLDVLDLACHRGGRQVFEGVSFSLQAGELLELRGPNGSGKSSLLRLIAGIDEPARGEIRVEGAEYRNEVLHLIGHGEASKPVLTVLENLQFWSDFLGGGNAGSSLQAFNMQSLANLPASVLSEGQRRRLALTRLVLVHRPLWLLDEPSVGLDQSTFEHLRAVMKVHLAEGGMIIASTHVDLGLSSHQILQLGAAP